MEFNREVLKEEINKVVGEGKGRAVGRSMGSMPEESVKGGIEAIKKKKILKNQKQF
jgi:hypothetical protein